MLPREIMASIDVVQFHGNSWSSLGIDVSQYWQGRQRIMLNIDGGRLCRHHQRGHEFPFSRSANRSPPLRETHVPRTALENAS